MEEKFSVSLELMIQKFKDKAKQVQDVSKNVANKIKENMSVDVGSNAFKGMNAESELLLNKINDIKATLQMANDNPKLLPKQDILEMRVELEKLEGQYNKINQSSNMFSSSFNKIQDGMKKSLNSAKRFTLSLFGIQSVFRMLSRASSAYLSQDEETSSKIQSAWIGLGSIFAPLLQTIANFAIKAVSYINVFIKALTGTDFLANAMAKSMNKAGKSAGKLSKILAGFDELTNLDDSAGGANVDTSWIDAFKNVELDPNITNFFQKLGEAMKPVYDNVMGIVDWFKQLDTTTQILIITLGIGGLVGALIGGTKGMSVGFAISSVITLISGFNDLLNGDTTDSIDGFIKIAIGSAGLVFALELLAGGFAAVNAPLILTVAGLALLVGGIIEVAQNWSKMTGLEKVITVLGLLSVAATVAAIAVGALQSAWTLGVAAVAIAGGIAAITYAINNATDRAKKDAETLANNIGSSNGGGSRGYAKGLDYVPFDGMYQLHKDETVVPAKFTPSLHGLNGSNNEDVVNKIDELIEALERKDMSVNIDKNSIGQASVSYINSQKRVLGRGVI